jgi:hypothetical protein
MKSLQGAAEVRLATCMANSVTRNPGIDNEKTDGVLEDYTINCIAQTLEIKCVQIKEQKQK